MGFKVNSFNGLVAHNIDNIVITPHKDSPCGAVDVTIKFHTEDGKDGIILLNHNHGSVTIDTIVPFFSLKNQDNYTKFVLELETAETPIYVLNNPRVI